MTTIRNRWYGRGMTTPATPHIESELDGYTRREADRAFTLGYLANVADWALAVRSENGEYLAWEEAARTALLDILVRQGVLLPDPDPA